MKVNKASRNILTLFIHLNVVRYTTMKQTSASLSFSHFSTRYHTFIVINNAIMAEIMVTVVTPVCVRICT